jgi:hypothetical protein
MASKESDPAEHRRLWNPPWTVWAATPSPPALTPFFFPVPGKPVSKDDPSKKQMKKSPSSL